MQWVDYLICAALVHTVILTAVFCNSAENLEFKPNQVKVL